MNRSRITGDLVSQNNIFVDIANDRVGIGSTIPGEKLSLPDSAKIALGNGSDLQLYHTGSHSHIQNYTGEFRILGNQLRLKNKDNDETYISCDDNGAVQIYHNNDLAFATQADGISAFGREGNNANIYLFADEADDLPDQWRIRALAASSTLEIQNRNTNALYDTNLVCKGDGAVELYHNNSKKLETTSVGVTVTGELRPVGNLVMNTSDNLKILFGASNDLQIFHDGSHSRIKDVGTGILSLSASQLNIQNAAVNENMAEFFENGAVNLYYDNVKKFETTSYGVLSTEAAKIEGDYVLLDNSSDSSYRLYKNGTPLFSIRNNTVNGVHINTQNSALLCFGVSTGTNSGTVESTLSINSSGNVGIDNQQASEKLHLADSKKLALGNSADLKIYHDGSHSYIDDTGTGNLKLRSNNFRVSNADESKLSATFVPSGAVELYHNNAKKLSTVTTGIEIHAPEANNANIYMTADEGDDNGDEWILQSQASTNNFNFYNNTSGSAAVKLSIKPDGEVGFYGNLVIPENIVHSGDTNTRIRFPSADTIQFETSGSVALRIDSSGRVRTDNGTQVSDFDITRSNSTITDTMLVKGNAGNSFIRFQDNDSSCNWTMGVDDGAGLGANGFVWYDRVNSAYRLSIDNGGNLKVWSGQFQLNTTNDEHIILSGSSNPYIRFQEGTTNRAYIQWHSDDYLQIHNQQSGDGIRIRSGSTGLKYNVDGSEQTIWHAGNDGSGSGLDADTLDGVQGSSYLRSDAADTGTTLTLTDALRTDRFEDQGGAFFWREGLTSGRHRHLNLADTTGDPATVADSSNPTGISWGQRSDNNAYYMLGLKGQYNNGYSSHSRLTLAWHTGIEIGSSATYGGVRFMGDSPFINTTEIMQVNSSGGHVKVKNNLYANNGGLVWNANNDGAGSGLDADLLDGLSSGSFLRSDVNDTQALQRIEFKANDTYNYDTIADSAGNKGCIEIFNNGNGNDAFMAFHTGSDFAFYFGLDADTNKLAVGGWSMGANKYAIFHENNVPTFSQLGITAADINTLGVNATTLDSLDSSSFLRSDADDAVPNYTHNIRFYSNSSITSSSGSQASLECFNGSAGNDAFMAFHVSSDFAAYFGLDGGTNDFAVGGWSMGGVSNKVWHAGNDGSGSGLDADTLDGHQVTDLVETNQNSGYILKFGSGGNSGHSSSSYPYAIFQEGGAWSHPYPDLRINYHTGIVIAVGAQQYDGLRFQRDYNDTTQLASIGDGDNNTRINYQLFVSGTGRNRFDGNTTFGASGVGFTLAANGQIHSHTVGHNASNNEGIFWHNSGSNYGIYRTAGNWSGNYSQLRLDWPTGIIMAGGSGNPLSGTHFQSHVFPWADNTYDLGSASKRWRFVYTTDLHLSNENTGGNEVDGTEGNWTLQEGEDDIYMINRKNGKRYKIKMEEV